jgi:uncharacterized alkaline shock family protein YloU
VEEDLGKVTIAPGVLVTIVQKAAVSVPGVVRLSPNIPGVGRFLGLHTVGQGVRVQIIGQVVAIDVYLVAARGTDLYQMGRQLQRQITRAIHDIVGMDVREVNVHIEGIEASPTQQ